MRKINERLEVKWGTSRGRDTYGYTTCSLYVNGRKVAACNGGGYDMRGTVIGNYIAAAFAPELLQLDASKGKSPYGGPAEDFYGLTYHDPDFDPGKYVPPGKPVFGDEADIGKTVEQLENEGKSFGLDRYQAFYSASSKVPTERHRIPLIDGACGMSSVERIISALGLELEHVLDTKKLDLYILKTKVESEVNV